MAGLELWWLGQAGFRLRDPAGGPVVFCDPFISAVTTSAAGRRRSTPRPWRQADVILVSHEHSDHLDRPALKAAAARRDRASRWSSRDRSSPSCQTRAGLCRRAARRRPARRTHRPRRRAHPARSQRAMASASPMPTPLATSCPTAWCAISATSSSSAACAPTTPAIAARTPARPSGCAPCSRILPCCPSTAATSSARPRDNIVGNMDFREAARLAHDMGVELLVPMHWELFAGNRGFPGDLLAYVETTFPRAVGAGHGPRRARSHIGPRSQALDIRRRRR